MGHKVRRLTEILPDFVQAAVSQWPWIIIPSYVDFYGPYTIWKQKLLSELK